MDLPSTIELKLPKNATFTKKVRVEEPCKECEDGVCNGKYCDTCNALGYVEVYHEVDETIPQ